MCEMGVHEWVGSIWLIGRSKGASKNLGWNKANRVQDQKGGWASESMHEGRSGIHQTHIVFFTLCFDCR